MDFGSTRFSGGLVDVFGAKFSGGQVSFADARLTAQVSILLAKFSGGELDVSKVADWSHPPQFDGDGRRPGGG